MTTWCIIHDRQATTFCCTCSRCTCSGCAKSCKGHEQVKLMDACDIFKKELEDADIDGILERLQSKSEELHGFLKNMEDIYRRLKELHMESSEETKKKNKKLDEEKVQFEEIMEKIKELQSNITSQSLGSICEVILANSNIGQSIDVEKKSNDTAHYMNTKLTSRARSVVYAYKERIACLDTLLKLIEREKNSNDQRELLWEEKVALLSVIKFKKPPELSVFRNLLSTLEGSKEIMSELEKFQECSLQAYKVFIKLVDDSMEYEESSIDKPAGDRIGQFTAFEGADQGEEIPAAMSSPMTQIADRIFIGQPIWIDGIQTDSVGTWMYASLSNKGLFIVAYESIKVKTKPKPKPQTPRGSKGGSSRSSTRGKTTKTVTAKTNVCKFINLLSGDQCALAIPDRFDAPINVFAVDDKVFFIPNKAKPHYTMAMKVFDSSSFDVFDEIEDAPECNGFCDSSVVAETRTIVYTIYNPEAPNSICEISVDNINCKITQLSTDTFLYGQASLTGIKIPSIRSILYTEGPYNGISSLKKKRPEVVPMLDSHGWNPMLVFPSQQDPYDLSKSVVLYDGCFASSDMKEECPIPQDQCFSYQYGVSIVRLCMDCFLLYDSNVHKWCVIRIGIE